MRFLLLSLFLISYNFAQAQSWQVTPLPNLPESLTNNAVCEGFINDTSFVFTFGGLDSTKLYSGIHQRSYRYNTITKKWLRLPDLPDSKGKIAMAASRIGDTIYIIGGYHVFANGSETSSQKVHRYRVSTNSFLSDGAKIPKAIDDHVQAVWRDSLIYVITGWSNSTNVPNVQIYNPSLDTWTQGTFLPSSSYKSFGASGTIIGDTIYYFGGARIANNFPIQKDLRKGIIDPQDPSQINWSTSIPDPAIAGYRMACTSVKGQPIWMGGSPKTYNYDGIAYDGSGGVEPSKRSLYLPNPSNPAWMIIHDNLPMDLRGIASANDTTKYLIGGMIDNQQVTNQLLQLVWHQDVTATTVANSNLQDFFQLSPNPAQTYVQLNFAQALPGPIEQIIITNLQGKNILKTNSIPPSQKLDIQFLPQGIYFLTVKIKAQKHTQLLIKI